jgi:hypothetical protein
MTEVSHMRLALSVLMALHGVAHLVGFVGPWRFAVRATAPYKTTVLAGRFDVGDRGIRVVGALWLLTALAFLFAAVGGATNSSWWIAVAATVTVASVALSAVEWPEVRIGLLVNLGIIAALALGYRFAWL